MQIHCPFCAGGKSGWHLGIHIESGNGHCWRCGKLPTAKILRAIVPTANLREIFRTYTTHRRAIAAKIKIMHATDLEYPPDVRELGYSQCKYLTDRNFDPDFLVVEWGLKGVGPMGGEWAWRILIPICNQMGHEVSYTSRALSESRSPRYLTASNERSLENPRSLLYGEQYAEDTILVVEGPTDVWRIGRGAVATLGTSWTKEQAVKISKYKRRLIMFDNETEAQKHAQELAGAVAAADGTTDIITGLKTDPGDLTSSEVAELRLEIGL